MHGLEKIVRNCTAAFCICAFAQPFVAVLNPVAQKEYEKPVLKIESAAVNSQGSSYSSLNEALEEHIDIVNYSNSKKRQEPQKQGSPEQKSQEQYVPKVYTHADTEKKEIAITIDDIYDSVLLRKALDLAEKYDVKFTFFPIGRTVKANAELYKEALQDGDEIELHTYTHAWATNKEVQGTFEKIYKNYADDISIIKKLVDKNLKFHFARPPGGAGYFGYINTKLGIYEPLSKAIGALKNYNFGTAVDFALWNGDSMFVNGKLTDSAYVYSYFKKNLSPGDIFLYHTREADFAVMESIIKYAKEKGYKMVTLAELLGK